MINAKYQEGNIVNHYHDGDEYQQVTVVGQVYDRVHIMWPTGGGTDVDIKTIEPIPLTPEWLERCGFLQNEGRFMTPNMKIAMTKNYIRDASGDYDGFSIVFNTFTGTLPQVIKSVITVKHLHQLQNLYFALTGEELNVKL